MQLITYATNRTRRLAATALFCLAVAAPATADLNRAPVPGGTLEYEIRGDGEPVLLIHGAHVAGSFLAIMDEPVLADFSLIRYHRRGYAGSAPAGGEPSQWIATAAADAAALLRHLDVDRAHVVGHSSGGLIALQLALDAPDLVHSLILLEPAMMAALAATDAGGPAADDANASDTLTPGVERYLEGDAAGAVDAFMQAAVSPQWRSLVTTHIPGGVEQAERGAATFFELELPAVNEWAFDARAAGRITRPVLNVVGRESGPYHYEISGLVTTWFGASEELIVPDVTHALHMQDPAEVAAAIAGFAKRHSME
jgi:pimeloyl-ACP methyl ester carboxylesterase